jgi:hypothetical protein
VNNTLETCYMCERVPSCTEHVPPKCLFPEKKDVGSDSFRKNLITVPSCDEHNSKKSDDDEFLMVSIAGIVGNNSIGYIHNMTKVNRALRRTSYKLLNKVFSKKQHGQVRIKDNKFIDVIWGTPDVARLYRCFEHIAHGIYYHEFKSRFIGEIKLIMGFLTHKETDKNTFAEFIRHRFDVDVRNKPKEGFNQNIFYYQFIEPDKDRLIALKMCFYQGVNVYISFLPASSKMPYNLGFDLMNKGIETHISLYGKDYVFNKS